MVCAIIVRHGRNGKGFHFLTPNHYSQQAAWMSHKRGKMIDAHVHHRVPRAITQTQEVLCLTKGAMQVDFYYPPRQVSLQLKAGKKAYDSFGFRRPRIPSAFGFGNVQSQKGSFFGKKYKMRFAHCLGLFKFC